MNSLYILLFQIIWWRSLWYSRWMIKGNNPKWYIIKSEKQEGSPPWTQYCSSPVVLIICFLMFQYRKQYCPDGGWLPVSCSGHLKQYSWYKAAALGNEKARWVMLPWVQLNFWIMVYLLALHAPFYRAQSWWANSFKNANLAFKLD